MGKRGKCSVRFAKESNLNINMVGGDRIPKKNGTLALNVRG